MNGLLILTKYFPNFAGNEKSFLLFAEKKMKKIMPFMLLLLFCFLTLIPAYADDDKSEIDPEKKKDIVKLLKLMGNYEVAEKVIEYTIRPMKMMANVPEGYWETVKKMFDPMDLIEMNAKAYDKYFTHDEIKVLVRFYESPAGKKHQKLLVPISETFSQNEQEYYRMIYEKVTKKLEKDGYVTRAEEEKND